MQSPIQTYLEELHHSLIGLDDGALANYIPELTKADPAWFDISIVTMDGVAYTVGDVAQPFTIPSNSKPFVYATALADRGVEAVAKKVGVEPSGDAFNSISLDPQTGAPLNPMINAGAITTTTLVAGDDMNTQWKGLTIRDKVEGVRVIPLTPFVSQLLATLPRRNEWVFSSTNSKAGHITEPNHAHSTACTVAAIDGLTLHGLRRSFKSLTEWLEIPAGVVAQLMGHKPSATAEKHYTVRPLDLLRVHHEKIESWILEQAGIVFDAKAAPGSLRVVAG